GASFPLRFGFGLGAPPKMLGCGHAIPPRKFCEKILMLDMMNDVAKGSISMADKYLEQYERMQRSYDRFREIKPGLTDKISSDYEDDVYAFFLHCYHLKDWVKNDTSVKSRMPNIGPDVERFINESEALSLCADLCNSLNHLELKKEWWSRTPDVRAEAISSS